MVALKKGWRNRIYQFERNLVLIDVEKIDFKSKKIKLKTEKFWSSPGDLFCVLDSDFELAAPHPGASSFLYFCFNMTQSKFFVLHSSVLSKNGKIDDTFEKHIVFFAKIKQHAL